MGTVASNSREVEASEDAEQLKRTENLVESLTDDVLLRVLLCLPPKETGDFLASCRAAAELAALTWRVKADGAAAAAKTPGDDADGRTEDDDLSGAEGGREDGNETAERDMESRGARYWREEYSKRLLIAYCVRPSIDAWSFPPHWYPDHPEPSSPYGAVRRCKDVTEFRMSARSRRLEEGKYLVRWRVNSTSGFCVHHMSYRVVNEGVDGLVEVVEGSEVRGVWNARDDRGSGWKKVTVGDGLVEVGPDGGVVESKLWKNDLQWAGGILVDYVEMKATDRNLEEVKAMPNLLGSSLLTSDW